MRRLFLFLACCACLSRTGRLELDGSRLMPPWNGHPAEGEPPLSAPLQLSGPPLLPVEWLDVVTFDLQGPAEARRLAPRARSVGGVPDPVVWACVAAGIALLLASASPRRRVGQEKAVSPDNIPRVPVR